MCIGNRDGGDDAVGPYVADKLKNDFTVIDAGTVPENYTSVVKKHDPKNLIIVDAVDMSLEPGEIRIVPKEKIGVMHISTHGIPISVMINYLEQYVENIIFIGIQPKVMSGSLTDVVKKSGEQLAKLVKSKNLEKIEIFN
ncbi:MAG: hydrogenase maturation peptidase HycI [Thermoplasmatales archaeon]|nr:hydrogenase maturation peptidase HycI [Thermoplasmatales archaeon]